MDSRSYTFKGEQEFIVEKSNFNVNLIHPNNFDFFETLRKKLNWGFDLRN
jgi:NAD+ kinase